MPTEWQRKFLEQSDERDMWVAACLQMWRWGFAAGQAAAAREGQPMTAQLDFDEPGEWPCAQMGPMPKIDPALDRRRYPPGGRRSWLIMPTYEDAT